MFLWESRPRPSADVESVPESHGRWSFPGGGPGATTAAVLCNGGGEKSSTFSRRRGWWQDSLAEDGVVDSNVPSRRNATNTPTKTLRGCNLSLIKEEAVLR